MTQVMFQGRKTARQSSEQRRLAILQATLRVVVRDGVRGVRHRAVAAEANVPLSATTYYFKDIHDLIADAFTLYATEVMEQFVEPFWRRCNDWLGQFSPEQLRQPAVREQVLDRLGEWAAEYILDRLQHNRDMLQVEMAFLYASTIDERLRPVALRYQEQLRASFRNWLTLMGVQQVELGAKALVGTVRRIEYEGLLNLPGADDPAQIKQALMHQVRGILSQ